MLRSARQHRVPTQKLRLLPCGETYTMFRIEPLEGTKKGRLTLEVIGQFLLERKICQQAQLFAIGANQRSRLTTQIPRNRSSPMLPVPHARTRRLISKSTLTDVRATTIYIEGCPELGTHLLHLSTDRSLSTERVSHISTLASQQVSPQDHIPVFADESIALANTQCLVFEMQWTALDLPVRAVCMV